MIEEWRDIKGYEGKYQVSNLGNTKSLDRTTKWRDIDRFFNGQPLIHTPSKKGYLLVSLCEGSHTKKTTYQVHRLVWKTFIGEIPPNLAIDHINEDKQDNRLENLQLLTNRENCIKGKAKYRDLPTGCYLRKDTGRYASRIQIDGKDKYLGNFDTELEASLAYQKALSSL
jgi:hypothetical protein